MARDIGKCMDLYGIVSSRQDIKQSDYVNALGWRETKNFKYLGFYVCLTKSFPILSINFMFV